MYRLSLENPSSSSRSVGGSLGVTVTGRATTTNNETSGLRRMTSSSTTMTGSRASSARSTMTSTSSIATSPTTTSLTRHQSDAMRWQMVKELQQASFNGQRNKPVVTVDEDQDIGVDKNSHSQKQSQKDQEVPLTTTSHNKRTWRRKKWSRNHHSRKLVETAVLQRSSSAPLIPLSSSSKRVTTSLKLPRFRSKQKDKQQQNMHDCQESVVSAPTKTNANRRKNKWKLGKKKQTNTKMTTDQIDQGYNNNIEDEEYEETMSVMSLKSLGSLFSRRRRRFRNNQKASYDSTLPRVVAGTTSHVRATSPTDDMEEFDEEITLASGLADDHHVPESDGTSSRESKSEDGVEVTEQDYHENSYHQESQSDEAPIPLAPKRQSSLLDRLLNRSGSKRELSSPVATPETAPESTEVPKKDDDSSDSSYDDEIMASSSSSIDVDCDVLFGGPIPMDRWSPVSVEVDPDAPKQPIRRPDTDGIQAPKRRSSDPSLDSSGEGSSDDDSAISLLSGLLAAFVAERDAEVSDRESPRGVIDGPGQTASSPRRGGLKSPPTKSGNNNRQSRHAVSFGVIHIREYERTVGDNPACSSGPPISLGWGYIPTRMYKLEEYESAKPIKRTKRQFYLPASKRHDILVQEWRFTLDDIRKARREATYIQYCREKSAFSGKKAAAKEAAFLRQANGATKKANPDNSDTSQPPTNRPRQTEDTVPAPSVTSPPKEQRVKYSYTSPFQQSQKLLRSKSSQSIRNETSHLQRQRSLPSRMTMVRKPSSRRLSRVASASKSVSDFAPIQSPGLAS